MTTERKPLRSLKALRAEKGLTQKDMAKIMEISNSAYIAKENGERDFRLTELTKAKNQLNIDASIFFKK